LIYNNLIYFLVVILILATNSVPARPQIPLFVALALFILKGLVYRGLLKRVFSKGLVSGSRYGSAERNASILAIVFFSVDIYLLDAQFYFSKLPLAHKLPVLVDFAALLLFIGYLAMMWGAAAPCYGRLFGRSQSKATFVRGNVESNLPIVLPWLLLSLFADLLRLSPWIWVRDILSSAWGEPIVSLLFFLCLALTFPALIVRIWHCTPLPEGPARQRLVDFCQRHNVRYTNIMLWPMCEGQALTAGVMGMIPQCRYLLVTPALLAALTPDEMEAVMAHEIGHVKKRHLQIYILLFLGFGLFAQLSSYPILYLFSNSDLFFKMVHFVNQKPGHALDTVNTVAMFVLMIVYFRYILGFFMRNFERQADLFALRVTKSAEPLVRVFDKIAWLSGTSKDQPSWHHFGIGERVDFLRKCEREKGRVGRHDRKIYGSLVVYVLVLALSAFTLWRMPDNPMAGATPNYAKVIIQQKMSAEPGNYVWPQLLGDLQYSRKKYAEAVLAYQKSLLLNPDNAEVLNNLAWLLLTADDHDIRNPKNALRFAERAMIEQPAPHILDTLAQAYWVNGRIEQAEMIEKRALASDPPNSSYYLGQLRKFSKSLPKIRE
jgi:Zn-dependent protease with chaperone function